MRENHGSTGQASYLRVFLTHQLKKDNQPAKVWMFDGLVGFQCQKLLRTRSV